MDKMSRGDLGKYDVIEISEYIIQQYDKNGKSISPFKLQPILYFVQANFLVNANKPCFSNYIEAWDFGPVVLEVYHKYKIYGAAGIPVMNIRNKSFNIPAADLKLIDDIIEQCLDYSMIDLLSMAKGQRPWLEARSRLVNRVLRNDVIRDYFKEK